MLLAAFLWIVIHVFGVTMNMGEILLWESTNALLLIPVVIGVVMLVIEKAKPKQKAAPAQRKRKTAS